MNGDMWLLCECGYQLCLNKHINTDTIYIEMNAHVEEQA